MVEIYEEGKYRVWEADRGYYWIFGFAINDSGNWYQLFYKRYGNKYFRITRRIYKLSRSLLFSEPDVEGFNIIQIGDRVTWEPLNPYI